MLKNLYAVCKQLGDVQYSSPCCGDLTLSAGGQPGWIILRGFWANETTITNGSHKSGYVLGIGTLIKELKNSGVIYPNLLWKKPL